MHPTVLVEAEDAHFRWMLGRDVAAPAELKLPAGGVTDPETLSIVRRMTARLYEAGSRGSWLVVSGSEVAGLCSYKQAPRNGIVEIGYGIAQSHQQRGHATRAVTAMLDYARNDPAVTCVTASTAAENAASRRALERNGFVQTGTGHDPDDGDLVFWRHDLR